MGTDTMMMNFAARPALLAGAAMMAVAATAPAHAQAAPAAATIPDTAEVVSNDPAAGSNTGLGDIVVTATKRETNLQKTPIAISVLDSTAIADRHVQSLLDLADGGVPSLRVATFEARQSALTIGIRGIVPFDQNQTARDSGVGVYIDGVYLGRSQGLNAALFDVARIEVLKGPQGTLFGRNTEGGALSVVTKPPSGTFEGRMSAGVGNYGQHNAEMHLDLPSYQDISVKLDGVYQHQGPTVTNPLAGSIGWNAYDRVGGRIAARWKPTDAFTADVAFDKAKDQNTPFFSQLINFNPLGYTVVSTADQAARVAAGQSALPASNGTTRYISALPALVGVHPDRQDRADIGVPQQYSVDRTQGVSANLRYAVAPALELRSITAWRRVSTDQWDNSGGPARTPFTPNGKFSRYSLSDLHQSQFSQEFQAVGSVSQIDYVASIISRNRRARPRRRRRPTSGTRPAPPTRSCRRRCSARSPRATRAGTIIRASCNAAASPARTATPPTARPPIPPTGRRRCT